MKMMDAVFEVLSQYAEFSGRARRAEYWNFTLFKIVVDAVAGWAAGSIGLIGFLGGVFNLAVIIPTLAVTVRRLHDTGRSGWWILINLVPAVGSIIFLVWLCNDSSPGDNPYGPNPKY